MTYNRDNLPTTYLTPPIPAPHANLVKTWKRDWTVYWIATHWKVSDRGSEWGKYNAIGRWLAHKTGDTQLSRQRLHQLVIRVHWMLRAHMQWQDEIIEELPHT